MPTRLWILLLLLPFAGACERSRPDAEAGTAPLVVATLHPLASVLHAVAGDAVRTRTLLPPGVHADSYEASPRDAEALAGAELLVRVGGAADSWIGNPEGLPTVVFTEGMSLHGEGGPGTGNPHVWLDPILVRDVLLPRLTEALVEVAPDSAPAIRRRAAAYGDSLTALDAEIRELLRDVASRRFIAAHAAWVYFAERYDLEPAGVLHASPGHEVGGRELARMVEQAREQRVPAVIAEPQLGRAGINALGRELRARIEVADPVGGPGMEGREDYLSLMRFNARAFARALGADPS